MIQKPSEQEVRRALLLLSPYANPNDDPNQGRREAALTVFRALGLPEGNAR